MLHVAFLHTRDWNQTRIEAVLFEQDNFWFSSVSTRINLETKFMFQSIRWWTGWVGLSLLSGKRWFDPRFASSSNRTNFHATQSVHDLAWNSPARALFFPKSRRKRVRYPTSRLPERPKPNLSLWFLSLISQPYCIGAKTKSSARELFSALKVSKNLLFYLPSMKAISSSVPRPSPLSLLGLIIMSNLLGTNRRVQAFTMDTETAKAKCFSRLIVTIAETNPMLCANHLSNHQRPQEFIKYWKLIALIRDTT